MKEMLLELEEGESELKYQYIKEITVEIVKNSKIRGAKYIPTPSSIEGKKAILNIQNKDDYCFLYCIAAADNPIPHGKHAYRTSNYNIENYNIANIKFPMELDDIEKFEQQNNKSINVYLIEEDEEEEITTLFEPVYLSKFDYAQKIDLLLLKEENKIIINEEDIKDNKKISKKEMVIENFHYTLIKNFNRLTHGLLYNTMGNNKKKDDPNYFFEICRKCLIAFTCKNTFLKHNVYCKTGNCGIKMPSKYSSVSASDYMQRKYCSKHPIVGILDFESILQPISEQAGDSTLKTQKHNPSSFGLYFITDLDIKNKFTVYRNEDVMDKVIKTIKDVGDQYLKLSTKFPDCPELNSDESFQHKYALNCCICNSLLRGAIYITKEGKEIKDLKVRHHCHFTGKYIGAAHLMCNLANSVPNFIPIYAHNASNYDSHFLIKNLNKNNNDGEIKIIPKTGEEYLSISKYYTFDSGKIEIRFLDTCKFLPASLDTLSSNLLMHGKENFKHLLNNTTKKEQEVIFWNELEIEIKKQAIINEKFDVKFKEIKKYKTTPRVKGIFPYDYVDSFEKYNEKIIPNNKYFYNKLSKTNVSPQEKRQFIKVWLSINNCDLGKYSDLYLKTDVLILADVLENFRELSLKHYKLDPVNYLTIPSLSWQAMLNHTQVKLELLHDYDMYKLFEDGIRGGISQVCGDRYVDVSNKNFITNNKINKDDPNQEWLYYFDANNLYGHSMSQKLPVSHFKWMEQQEIEELIIKLKNKQITGEEKEGYMLQIDIKYPIGSKEKFKSLPILTERKKILDEQLSDYTKKQYKDNKRLATEKLILDFTDKINYSCHIKNLIFYYDNGFIIEIKKGIKFFQYDFLKSYILLNTKLRAKATNEFEKDFFKLMNNSVFGKTMENVRLRIDLKLVKNFEEAKKYIRKPNFDYLKRFDEDLCAINMNKTTVYLNKPIYVGFAILELSKLHMFKFYYETLKTNFNDVNLLYMDTDSFILHLKEGNIIEKFKKLNDNFDFSDYPKNHCLQSNDNKKVVGKFKDELNGNQMTKFISLRSKMYSFQTLNFMKDKKICKGIKKSTIENELSFNDYYNCLFNNESKKLTFSIIKSENHNLYTEEITKKGLSTIDDKGYYLDNIHRVHLDISYFI